MKKKWKYAAAGEAEIKRKWAEQKWKWCMKAEIKVETAKMKKAESVMWHLNYDIIV